MKENNPHLYVYSIMFVVLSWILWLPWPVVICFYSACCKICKHNGGSYKFRFKSSKDFSCWLFYFQFCASIRFNITVNTAEQYYKVILWVILNSQEIYLNEFVSLSKFEHAVGS